MTLHKAAFRSGSDRDEGKAMAIHFDEDSVYKDRTGADGKFFDTFGNNQGYVDRDGRYFDSNRVFKGTRKEDGMFYDPSGRCLGYTSGEKWCFDPMGLFIESKRPTEKKEEAKEEPAKEEPKEEGEGVGGTLKKIWDKI